MRPTVPQPGSWIAYLDDSYRENRFSNYGPCVRLLEKRLAERFPCPGRRYILCASATTGLAAVFMALHADFGRTIGVPAFTFPATLQAIRMAECEPILCDVDPLTWEMDIGRINKRIMEWGVSGMLPVRTFGLCRDRKDLLKWCAEGGLPIVFDSAAALGGQFDDGSFVGSQGIAEVFSLHATKVFGIGEGGLICADQQFESKIREALNFGISGDRIHKGLNGKMSEFTAAVGLAVLDKIEPAIARRRVLAERYREAFRSLDITPPFNPGNPVWQTYPILLNEDAGAFVDECLDMGVEVRRYYRPSLSGKEGVSGDLANRMVCLPVYSDMTVEEQSQVIQVVTDCIRPASY
jgi:dTDP-4-amino-4,6-dideoxygalactose transaminase